MSKYVLAIETSSSLCSLALISMDNNASKILASENYAGIKCIIKSLCQGL